MKRDIYIDVTQRIIEQLEKGVVPWKSPYFSTVGFPKNFLTDQPYHGINVFLLGLVRYTSPYFLTFLQAKELGGHIKKGEKGHLVIKYGSYLRNDDIGTESRESQEKEIHFLKAYTVFNASQIEGIAFPENPTSTGFSASNTCARARDLVAAMPRSPVIREGFAIPSYQRGSDSVQMPERRFFQTEEAYYSTLFHELAHSTGHESRLARPSLLQSEGINAEGDARKIYAEEELVAEMAAAFLCGHAGIVEAELENSAAYLNRWIRALKSKDAKGWIIRAASQAQKAADFILDVSEDEALEK